MSRLASFIHNLKMWDSNYAITPHVRERYSARVLAAVGQNIPNTGNTFAQWHNWRKTGIAPRLGHSKKALKQRIWEVLDEPT